MLGKCSTTDIYPQSLNTALNIGKPFSKILHPALCICVSVYFPFNPVFGDLCLSSFFHVDCNRFTVILFGLSIPVAFQAGVRYL
jgi:hypothetical protein